MMTRCVSKHVAESLARERDLLIGRSVFPAEGFPVECPWYVGTEEQLRKIGVLNPEPPDEVKPE